MRRDTGVTDDCDMALEAMEQDVGMQHYVITGIQKAVHPKQRKQIRVI